MSVDDTLAVCGLSHLGESPSSDAIGAALKRFGEVVSTTEDPVEGALLVEGATKALRDSGISAPKKLIEATISGEKGKPVVKLRPTQEPLVDPDPEPWPEEVPGEELLDEVASTFRRYVALPTGAAEAIALWVALTYVHDTFLTSPILAFLSPEMGCGKTTALAVLKEVSRRPFATSHTTPAAIFRLIDACHPTLILDEADSYLQHGEGRETFRGVLNSGHNRATAVVTRSVGTGDDYAVGRFSTWAPKAVGAIGELSGTLMDRSIVVRMRRATDDEVERLTARAVDSLGSLRPRLIKWALQSEDRLRDVDPALPRSLRSRARDNWRPLIAIADDVGGRWPNLAREVAVLLSGAEAESRSPGTQLLEDIRVLFATSHKDRLPSKEVASRLLLMEDRPWGEWRGGRAITVHQIAHLFKPFGISPKKFRDGVETHRGYDCSDFEDAWARYLTPSQVEQPEQPSQDATFLAPQSGT